MSKLRDHERCCRRLIESASGLIALLGPQGALCYINPAVERILGYTADELKGKELARYVHPEDAPMLRRFLVEVRRHPGALMRVEFRIRHQDQSWRLLGASARNLLADPVLRGIVMNAQDITERRQLEEQMLQSQKLEAMGRLASGIAHDFNNMLGAITGYADMLRDRLAPDQAAHSALQEIIKATDRAAALTRQLLLFSRKQTPQPQALDLGEVLADMHSMLRRLIGENIELVTLLDPVVGRVKADRGRIDQVLLNLAVNARDAMPGGGKLTLRIRNVGSNEVPLPFLHGDAERRSSVLLEVSDTGCGMDRETQARIFEPFFTTKRPGEGTGLGLATVYAIIDQAGGTIQVDSAPGQGTTFRIYLPRTEEERGSEPAGDTLTAPPSGSETILLAEDEPILQRMVHAVLEAHGYTVLKALQGDEALRLCERHESRIDLLLTDVVMPGMSGRELAEQATTLRPEMKVLFMSGYTDDLVPLHGVGNARCQCLAKPFTPGALARRVREALEAG